MPESKQKLNLTATKLASTSYKQKQEKNEARIMDRSNRGILCLIVERGGGRKKSAGNRTHVVRTHT